MPQLSPLNWILLFSLAWFSSFLMFILIWWYSKAVVSYSTLPLESSDSKWSW